MQTIQKHITALALSAGLTGIPLAYAAEPLSNEELQDRVDNLERRLDATADMVEQAQGRAGEHGAGGRTTVGGYGELHYNNLDSKKEVDFHRFILFLAHEFSDDVRLFSEIEYEHANTEANGVVELEQAYLEFDLNDRTRARGGLFLIPVGILNETHEPPTFYGVERNPVEHDIVPSTWWAGGTDLSGELGRGFSYDLAVHEGLNTSAADNYSIREGRQSTSEAVAEDLAYTGRLKWTGMPGVELAATFQHQTDITQSSDSTAGSANLYEAHGILNRGPFTFKALYATWDLEGTGPAALGSDQQEGWYVEPSYKVTDKFGIFARYNEWDNEAGSAADTTKEQTDVGLNYWPHPDVVLKADLMDQGGAVSDEGFNLGVGYRF